MKMNRSRGFGLTEAIVLTVILSALIAIFLPQVKRRKNCGGPRIQCVNNEKWLGIAFRGMGLGWDGFPMTARTNEPSLQTEFTN